MATLAIAVVRAAALAEFAAALGDEAGQLVVRPELGGERTVVTRVAVAEPLCAAAPPRSRLAP